LRPAVDAVLIDSTAMAAADVLARMRAIVSDGS
jgi:hypothetical protein